MTDASDQLELIVRYLQGDRSALEPRPDEEWVDLSLKRRYRASKVLDIEARMSAKAPALEISTYGLSVAVLMDQDRRLEAQSWGVAGKPVFDCGVGVLADRLKPGRHTGAYTALVFVKVEGVYESVLFHGRFDFEVP